MPIYEYRCSKCSHIFEEWTQHFDSPDHEPCPECGGESSRIVSNTSFVLKGQGWYVTEYGNKNKTNHESGAAIPESDGAKAAGDTSAASDVAKPEGTSTEGKASEGKSADAKPASAPAKAAEGGASSGSAGQGACASPTAKGDTKAA